MQVTSSLNNLIQLEKKLEESTKKLAKLNKDGDDASTKQHRSTSNQHHKIHEDLDSSQADTENQDLNPAPQTIPIAYSVNSNKIFVQNTSIQSVLDIKV
ncbi:MAG: hypothetical protein IE909_06530 [Campylobacterales bacterium]|nr:hypothetical protein [Campylobacterales bacterium]